jgi:hypothetical protein
MEPGYSKVRKYYGKSVCSLPNDKSASVTNSAAVSRFMQSAVENWPVTCG